MTNKEKKEKTEPCILVKVVENVFNNKLKGTRTRIGQIINYPISSLDGVAVDELRKGDAVRVKGDAVGIAAKGSDTEFLKRQETNQMARFILVYKNF